MKKKLRFLCLASVLLTFSLACTENPTESKIEPGLKLIVISGQEVTEVESDETRTWTLPAEVKKRVKSVSAGPGGQLLLVEGNGDIGVVSGEETKEYKPISDEGLAASWSNDGQQIAIVRKTSQSGQISQSLEILDADFNKLWTETISQPGDDDNIYAGVARWSADDRLLAIRLQGSYLIVDVQTRKVFNKDGYSGVFFIDDRVLAVQSFQESSSEIQIAQVDLQADGVEIASTTTIVSMCLSWVTPIRIPILLVSASSNPARLVVWKPDPAGFPYYVNGTCSILDEQGKVLAEMPEIFGHNDAYCLTRSDAE